MSGRRVYVSLCALLALMPAGAKAVEPGAAWAAAPSAWAGPYLGLFAGYAWGRGTATAPFDPNTGFFYNFLGAPYSFDVDGFFGGATLGYNWQSDAMVFGIEGEVGYLGLTGSAIEPNDLPASPDTVTRFSSGVYGAAYARVGVTHGAALLYGKGGVALLDAKASTIDPCIAPPVGCGTTTLSMTGSRTMVGWSVGGGIEWAFAPQWSAKAEYVYFDFGRVRTSGPSSVPGELYGQSIGVTAHTVKFGANYRFSAAPTPVVARH